MKKYPYINYCRKSKNPGRKCDICKQKANYKIEIQVNFFRGDDEFFILCDSCKEEIINKYQKDNIL